MAGTDPVTHNIEAAQRTRERFEDYFLALTFTLLGLSVQTSEFGVLARDLVEIAAWVLLLISGLAGLSRLEWIPPIFGLASRKAEAEGQAAAMRKAILQGTHVVHVLEEGRNVPATEPLARAEATAQMLAEEITRIEKWQLRKYRAQKTTFVLGLMSVMASRAWAPLAELLQAVGS